jgi:hypothetical protein
VKRLDAFNLGDALTSQRILSIEAACLGVEAFGVPEG